MTAISIPAPRATRLRLTVRGRHVRRALDAHPRAVVRLHLDRTRCRHPGNDDPHERRERLVRIDHSGEERVRLGQDT